jgi:hypothetical protein
MFARAAVFPIAVVLQESHDREAKSSSNEQFKDQNFGENKHDYLEWDFVASFFRILSGERPAMAFSKMDGTMGPRPRTSSSS